MTGGEGPIDQWYTKACGDGGFDGFCALQTPTWVSDHLA